MPSLTLSVRRGGRTAASGTRTAPRQRCGTPALPHAPASPGRGCRTAPAVPRVGIGAAAGPGGPESRQAGRRSGPSGETAPHRLGPPFRAACCHLVGTGPRRPPPARRRERAAAGGAVTVSLRVPSAPLRHPRAVSAGAPRLLPPLRAHTQPGTWPGEPAGPGAGPGVTPR